MKYLKSLFRQFAVCLTVILVVFPTVAFAEAPAGFARLHYHRADSNYMGWGLHLWGDAHRLPEDTRWSEPFQPSGVDGFGVYYDVPIRPGAEELNFILHNGPEKHIQQDQVLALRQFHNEAWLIEGDSNIYPTPPQVGEFSRGWQTEARLVLQRQPVELWYGAVAVLLLGGIVLVSTRRYGRLHADIRKQQELLGEARSQLERQSEEYREVQQRTAALSGFDELTGLLNRSALKRALMTALAKARRSHTILAVFFIDLDDFKPINDRFGHAAGDHVLRTVAHRLSSVVRQSDAAARLGGDEFVVVAEDVSDPLAVARLARKLVGAITEVIPFENELLRVAASIGVALYPHDGDGAELIDRADAAMYEAKHGGKNAFRFASPAYNSLVLQQSEAETRWRDALAAGALTASWRPIQHDATGEQLAWMTFGAERTAGTDTLLPEVVCSDPGLAVDADLVLLEAIAQRAADGAGDGAANGRLWILAPSRSALSDPRFITACRAAVLRGAGTLVLELDAAWSPSEVVLDLAEHGVSFAIFCSDAGALPLMRIVRPGLAYLRLSRSGREPGQGYAALLALVAAAQAVGLPTVATLVGDEPLPSELGFDYVLRG